MESNLNEINGDSSILNGEISSLNDEIPILKKNIFQTNNENASEIKEWINLHSEWRNFAGKRLREKLWNKIDNASQEKYMEISPCLLFGSSWKTQMNV